MSVASRGLLKVPTLSLDISDEEDELGKHQDLDQPPTKRLRHTDPAPEPPQRLAGDTDAEGWLVVHHAVFEGDRVGLVGPPDWKEVVPAVGGTSRQASPSLDEIFSCLRGCGFFKGAGKEENEAKFQAFRHCAGASELGWQPFRGEVAHGDSASSGSSRPASSEHLDFRDGAGGGPRRVRYRIRPEGGVADEGGRRAGSGHPGLSAEDRGGAARSTPSTPGRAVELQAAVRLEEPFRMMVRHLRYPPVALEADWRITDGPPLDAQVISQARRLFKLLDNAADVLHPQPPNFRHSLRPEQMRSLRWMVDRETQGVPLTMEYRAFWHRAGGPAPRSAALEWSLDCRLTASYEASGGVLADEIGYGKTALAIALVDVRHASAPLAVPRRDEGFFFPSNATLVCVPSNLHEQWVGEFAKFTGGRYRILKLRTGADMRKATVRSLSETDVVVCNYQLLRGDLYEQRRGELIGLTPADPDKDDALADYRALFGGGLERAAAELPLEDLRRGTWGFLRDPLRHPWAKFLTGAAAKHGGETAEAWKRLGFPVLEQFFWRRVIFDEFHELEALQPAQRASLQFLRAHHRWGLTGTPLLGAASHIAAMASLLRVDLAGPIADPSGEGRPWPGNTDAAVVENCWRFLDACVRQNTSKERPNVRLVEHLVLVRHSPQERALYLAASQEHEGGGAWGGEGDGEGEGELQRRQRLLILCSHFSDDAVRSPSLSAGDECSRVLDMRRRAVDKAKDAVGQGMVALEAFRLLGLPPSAALEGRLLELANSQEERCKEVHELAEASASSARTKASEAATGVVQSAANFDDADVQIAAAAAAGAAGLKALVSALAGGELWKRTLKRAADPAAYASEAGAADQGPVEGAKAEGKARAKGKPKPPDRVQLGNAAEQCAQATAKALEELLASLSSLRFLERTLDLVAGGADAASRSCSVCYDEGLELEQLGITPCAHVFCLPCLRAQVNVHKKCGICRQPVSHVRPLVLEMRTPVAGVGAAEPLDADRALQGSPELRKYGTKLGRIALQLRRIKEEDAAAKCIVFCQWDSLLQKIASAFADFGIRHTRLKGSVHERTRTIATFKEAGSSLDVLLLSLEQSASGTNLTCANHVLLVHPMNAETQEQAVAFELQAIGRVRRWGQLRPEVHLWRFCTLGTVEEEITRRHQQEFFERVAMQGGADVFAAAPAVRQLQVAGPAAPPLPPLQGSAPAGPAPAAGPALPAQGAEAPPPPRPRSFRGLRMAVPAAPMMLDTD